MFVRNLLCYLLAGFVCACGFEPLYGPNSVNTGVIRDDLAQIKVARIQNREGQILRNYLVDLFTPAGQPTFPAAILEVGLTDVKVGVSLRKDGTTARYQVNLTANFILKDPQTQIILYQDTAKATDAYYVGEISSVSAYSSIISERDAKEKAIKLLAEEIQLLVASFYKQKLIISNENPKTT